MDYPDSATPLDPDELGGLKFKHIETRTQLDQMEQVNIQGGLIWLSKQKKVNILTLQFCLELHRRLFGKVWDWAGKFRQSEKNIGINPMYVSVELKKLLDDVQAWIEFRTYTPKESALRFHYRLVQIHVFANGNGRHARIMADALLKFIYKSPQMNWSGQYLQHASKQRENYIKALRKADAHDFEPLLSMFELLE
ncbi:MAG: mobile mystery protein B [Proteobacteria bacterium]|nr:mobile mystery protein B [Pseudomonadota bacterium]